MANFKHGSNNCHQFVLALNGHHWKGEVLTVVLWFFDDLAVDLQKSGR